jgi:hypothetical protein
LQQQFQFIGKIHKGGPMGWEKATITSTSLFAATALFRQ